MVRKLSLASNLITNLLSSYKHQPADEPVWLKNQNKVYYTQPDPRRHPHESYYELFGSLGPFEQDYEWWAVIMANRLSALKTGRSEFVNTDMMLLIRQVMDDIAKELSDLWSYSDTDHIIYASEIIIITGDHEILSKYRPSEWTMQYSSSLNSSICGLIIDMLVLHGVVASPLDAGDYHDLGTYIDVKERSESTANNWNLHDSVFLSKYIAEKWPRIIHRVQGVIEFAIDMNILSTQNEPRLEHGLGEMEWIRRSSLITVWSAADTFFGQELIMRSWLSYISWPPNVYVMVTRCLGAPKSPPIVAITSTDDTYANLDTLASKMNSVFDRRGFYVSVRSFTYPLLSVLVIIELFVLVGGIAQWEPMVINGVDPTSLASLVIVLEGLFLALVVATFHDNWSWYDMVRGQIVYENYYDLPASVKSSSYAVDVLTQAMSNKEACKHILASYGSCVTGITGDGTITLPVLNDDVQLVDTPFLTVTNRESALLIDGRGGPHALKGAYYENQTLHFDQSVETMKMSVDFPYMPIPHKLRVGSSLGLRTTRLEIPNLLKRCTLKASDKRILALQYHQVYRNIKS